MRKAIHSPAYRAMCAHLRRLRVDAGLRQVDLAEVLGVPQSMVASYEGGHRRLDIDELAQICDALGVDLGGPIAEFARARREFPQAGGAAGSEPGSS